LYGVGTSKKDNRANSSKLSLSNKQVSDTTHSYSYLANAKGTFKQLGEYAKDVHNVRDFEKISNDIVKAFIQDKIDKGVTKGSLEAYNSHLGKLQIALEKIAEHKGKEYKAFNLEARQEINQLVKDKATKSVHVNRAYHSTTQIIDNLKNKDHKLVAKIQVTTGVRVAEATHIKREQLDRKSYTLAVNGKGGKEHTVQLNKPLFNELVARVNKSVSNGEIGFKVNYSTYSNDLKQAVLQTNQDWHATHGFRYAHTQADYRNHILQGYSEQEALEKTSKNHAHNRAEITKTYL
jgi:integrase